MKLSVVIPVLNEEETLTPLVEGILAHTKGHSCRIIFVDDGSTDRSYEVMKEIRARYGAEVIDILRFPRKRGKSAALAAGFKRASGEVVLTMDADLQDCPSEIPALLKMLDEGHDVVCGWKTPRLDPWRKTFPSRVYNGLCSYLFKTGLHDMNTGFKAFRIEVVKRFRLYKGFHRFLPVLAAEMGYRVGETPVKHAPRRFGRGKYGPGRFLTGFFDIWKVFCLVRKKRPRRFLGAPGLVLALLGPALWLPAGMWARTPAGIVTLYAGGAALLAMGFALMVTGFTLELALGRIARTAPLPEGLPADSDDVARAARSDQ